MHQELEHAEHHDVMRAKRSITDIRSFVEEMPYARIAADGFARAAFERLLQRVSDTSRPVAARWKSEHPAVQWSMIGGIGDELQYAYDHVDLPVIWKIYENDLVPLEAAIDSVLATHSPKASLP